MTVPAAPLWLCFLPQLASVLGDSIGQRSARVYHNGSRRRFVLALVFVSCVQMFVILTIFQLAAPSLTTPINEKVNGTTVDYCEREGKGTENCYAQGPLTIYKAIDLCPMILVNGLMNVAYYIGEASMYKQPLGVLMLVLCALSSSFIIAPLQSAMHISHGKAPSVLAIIAGIIGAILCLVERDPKPSPADEDGAVDTVDDEGNSSKTPISDESSQLVLNEEEEADHKPMWKQFLHFLPLLGPYALLSFVYALYFVMMDYFNKKCKMNVWGYNAADQVLLPLYVYTLFVVVDLIKPLKSAIEIDSDQQETIVEAVKGAFAELFSNRGVGFATMFSYRFLINGRAMIYTYIATSYNLSASYLELTLIRVIISWVATLLLILVIPRFIQTSNKEARRVKDPVNVALKVVGTGAIIGSLLIIHEHNK